MPQQIKGFILSWHMPLLTLAGSEGIHILWIYSSIFERTCTKKDGPNAWLMKKQIDGLKACS
jgi:hypothetical protein